MNLAQASELFEVPGTVGVIPTDTVYGLVAKASDKPAVARLYALKDRDSKPGTIIAASVDQLVELGLKRRYLTAVKEYWPGAVSVIVPCGQELDYLHLGKNGLAVRIPNKAELLDLLVKVGPLLTSSANLSGQPTANSVTKAKAYFSELVDFYIDGGDLRDHLPSTIIRIIDDAIEVLREGAVKINQ